jgi:hypothetical protein
MQFALASKTDARSFVWWRLPLAHEMKTKFQSPARRKLPVHFCHPAVFAVQILRPAITAFHFVILSYPDVHEFDGPDDATGKKRQGRVARTRETFHSREE